MRVPPQQGAPAPPEVHRTEEPHPWGAVPDRAEGDTPVIFFDQVTHPGDLVVFGRYGSESPWRFSRLPECCRRQEKASDRSLTRFPGQFGLGVQATCEVTRRW